MIGDDDVEVVLGKAAFGLLGESVVVLDEDHGAVLAGPVGRVALGLVARQRLAEELADAGVAFGHRTSVPRLLLLLLLLLLLFVGSEERGERLLALDLLGDVALERLVVARALGVAAQTLLQGGYLRLQVVHYLGARGRRRLVALRVT